MKALVWIAALVPALAFAAPAESKRPMKPAQRGPLMKMIGYKILVEPNIVEQAPGQLATYSLTWKLRAVWRGPKGREVLVQDRGPQARDTDIRVDRPWEWTDVPRESRLFHKRKKAIRRFQGLRNSPDITLIGEDGGPAVAPPEPLPPPAQPTLGPPPHGHPNPPPRPLPEPEPAAPAPPDCRQILLAKGHHAMHLDKCKGVDPYCAAALLEAGHHPMHLDNCRAVESTCAEAVLRKGHSPMHLDKCTPDLRPGCVGALLEAGHSPMHLDKCSGVDDACAVALLKAGQHPMHLDKCRR
jgi:hypothetical protein